MRLASFIASTAGGILVLCSISDVAAQTGSRSGWYEGRSREAPPYPDCATALRVTAPLGCGSRRPGMAERFPFGPSTRPAPPFSLINSHPFGSARKQSRARSGEDESATSLPNRGVM